MCDVCVILRLSILENMNNNTGNRATYAQECRREGTQIAGISNYHNYHMPLDDYQYIDGNMVHID